MSDVLENLNYAVWGGLLVILLVQIVRSIRLVPNQWAYVVERLGKYQMTMRAGFHAMLPFFDKVVKKLDLREDTIDVPPQECFTKDEVKVEVDGVMYISVVDPVKATYGITNYHFAATQLAQTTTREVIGKLDLDQTFEERETISRKVVEVLDDAGSSWGVRVHRYEIKNIQPPTTVQDAMEKQVTAERNRRAMVARAEGDKQAMINRSEGTKQEMINRSEGEKQRRVNEAEGRAAEILAIARATADSLGKIGAAVERPGGAAALKLQLVEQYLDKVRALARPSADVLLPMDLSNLEGLLDGLKVSEGLRLGTSAGAGGPSGPSPRARPAAAEARPAPPRASASRSSAPPASHSAGDDLTTPAAPARPPPNPK
jgi:regulator of protease activity HflC (stomatin/prohibitin superfamily)